MIRKDPPPRRAFPLRVGIAGAGFAARFHYDSLPPLMASLEGVYSPRQSSRESYAAARKTRACSSVDELLEQVDVLDICSPPASHADYIVAAARQGKDVIVEKPLTGFFGAPESNTKQRMLDQVVDDLANLRDIVRSSGIGFGYAENYIYAPSVQEERRLIEASHAQVLRMVAEESHSGSHAPTYGDWSQQGGGALFVKGCHPLGGVLYLKRKEGIARHGLPIRPSTVSARTHTLTKLPSFQDKGYLRTGYKNAEDFGAMHVVFEDGTVADVLASDWSWEAYTTTSKCLPTITARGAASHPSAWWSFTARHTRSSPEFRCWKKSPPTKDGSPCRPKKSGRAVFARKCRISSSASTTGATLSRTSTSPSTSRSRSTLRTSRQMIRAGKSACPGFPELPGSRGGPNSYAGTATGAGGASSRLYVHSLFGHCAKLPDFRYFSTR